MMVSSSMGAEEDCGGSTVTVAVLVLDILTVIDAIDVERTMSSMQFGSIHHISIHLPV